MKAIAERRTKKVWTNCGTCSSEDADYYAASGPEIYLNDYETDDEDEASELASNQAEFDSEFCMMAANNFDALMKVVEAAKDILPVLDNQYVYNGIQHRALGNALKKLEGKSCS